MDWDGWRMIDHVCLSTRYILRILDCLHTLCPRDQGTLTMEDERDKYVVLDRVMNGSRWKEGVLCTWVLDTSFVFQTAYIPISMGSRYLKIEKRWYVVLVSVMMWEKSGEEVILCTWILETSFVVQTAYISISMGSRYLKIEKMRCSSGGGDDVEQVWRR